MADEKDTTTDEQATVSEVESTDDSVLEGAVRKVREQKEEKVPFNVVEEKSLPKSMRQVVVEVPRDEWEHRIKDLFKDIQQNATVEGFRKGKAPIKLLERRYMKEASGDVVEKMTPPIVREYEADKKLTIYGVPTITDFSTEGDGPVRITLELEVKPELDPQNYDGIEVEVPMMKVSDDMIQRRIEELRLQNATFEEVDRELKAEDGVVVDLKAVDSKGHTVRQDTGKFYENAHDELPHGVAHALIGKKAGATVDVKEEDGLRYTVTLKSVKEMKLPDIDDEFAKDVGHDSLKAMEKSLRDEYQRNIDEMNSDEAFEALTAKLVAAHEFDVPPALQKHVERDLARTDYMYITQTGITPPRLQGKNRNEYREELEKSAHERVKGFLLIDAIGRKENVEASEDDINKALEQRATAEGRKPVAIRAALERRKEWGQFTEQVRFNKIKDLLIARNKIKFVDKPVEEVAQADAAPTE